MRHPDEGEIHAWLDGALDPAASAELEAHVAACADCAAAVAEARGLIAGASRILLALDGVPSGVIPAPSQPSGAVPGDELASRRAQQQAAALQSARRRVPWYARRPVQIAAGLMLVAGVGGIVARSSNDAADQVSIQFETDASAPASKGPAADFGGVSSRQSAAAAEGKAAEPVPPAPRPPVGEVQGPPANQLPRRADQGAAGGAGVARESVAEQQRSRIAEERTAAVPPAPASVTANAPLAAARLTAPPMLMDSAANRLGGVQLDSLRMRRTEAVGFALASGTIAGKVIAVDNTPLGNASVTVAGANIGVQTAADGSFTLPPLPPGRYTIEARRIGYRPAKLDGVQLASGDTAYASLALQASPMQLSEVVVSGAATRMPNVAGACLVLNVDAGDDVAGIPLLPSRVRIRMAESPVLSGLAAKSALVVGAPQGAAARGYVGTPSEPVSPLPWQPVAADSIDVTWATETDVITLRLRIRGNDVNGTAISSQGSPARTAKVSGRKVVCGGGL